MPIYEVWFEDGPSSADAGFYCITDEYDSLVEVVLDWRDDPFYIGSNELGQDPPPVVQEWQSALGAVG